MHSVKNIYLNQQPQHHTQQETTLSEDPNARPSPPHLISSPFSQIEVLVPNSILPPDAPPPSRTKKVLRSVSLDFRGKHNPCINLLALVLAVLVCSVVATFVTFTVLWGMPFIIDTYPEVSSSLTVHPFQGFIGPSDDHLEMQGASVHNCLLRFSDLLASFSETLENCTSSFHPHIPKMLRVYIQEGDAFYFTADGLPHPSIDWNNSTLQRSITATIQKLGAALDNVHSVGLVEFGFVGNYGVFSTAAPPPASFLQDMVKTYVSCIRFPFLVFPSELLRLVEVTRFHWLETTLSSVTPSETFVITKDTASTYTTEANLNAFLLQLTKNHVHLLFSNTITNDVAHRSVLRKLINPVTVSNVRLVYHHSTLRLWVFFSKIPSGSWPHTQSVQMAVVLVSNSGRVNATDVVFTSYRTHGLAYRCWGEMGVFLESDVPRQTLKADTARIAIRISSCSQGVTFCPAFFPLNHDNFVEGGWYVLHLSFNSLF